MSTTATRRLTRHERRTLIERAATYLFARKGYAGTTVEDIVRAAGVTNPILYRYYESKRELCIVLLERYRDELAAAPLNQFVGGDGNPQQQLTAMIAAWLGHIERDPDAARLLLKPIVGDPEVERVQHELHVRQRAADTALLREFVPHLSQEDAEPLGEAIRGSLAAVALWWLDRLDRVPREVPARALLALCQGLLTNLTADDRSGR